MMLQLQDISKVYDKKKILEDVNLKIEEGETIGIIGPTGSGKTTLLRIIDLLEKPTSGRIIFDGIDALNTEPVKIRRRIGMVFQETPLLKGTVNDNILYGPRIRGFKPSKKKIEEVLEIVGLRGYGKMDARKLSGGEKQRLAFARALINQPDLLLLDEPTSNLDPISKKQIENIINKIRGQVTIIFTTHDLVQGQRLAEKIAILNKTIMQMGKADEVFQKPANSFVAEFLGVENIIKGEARPSDDELTLIEANGIKVYSSEKAKGEVIATIRPEDITVSWVCGNSSALNKLKGRIIKIEEMGPLFQLQVKAGEEIFTVHMTRKSFHDMNINLNSMVWIEFKASAVHIINQ